jgi:hypothetical protein
MEEYNSCGHKHTLSDTHHLQSLHLNHEKETTLLQWSLLIMDTLFHVPWGFY